MELLRNVPVGSRVFVRHFHESQMLNGEPGIFATVIATEVQYETDTYALKADNGNAFAWAADDYVTVLSTPSAPSTADTTD